MSAMKRRTPVDRIICLIHSALHTVNPGDHNHLTQARDQQRPAAGKCVEQVEQFDARLHAIWIVLFQ